MGQVEARLQELGITLPTPPAPVASYVPFQIVGNIVHVSGQVSVDASGGIKGKLGDALIFWNLNQQGEREMDSLHAGLPVTKGEKWLLSKWVRQRPVPLA